MVSPDNRSANASVASAVSTGIISSMSIDNASHTSGTHGIPVLTLAMNGAIIGRKKGPYVQFFEQHAYVSGVHAQLKYVAGSGWSVTDKHSSNGTKLNQRMIQPDVEMTLNNGDVLTIANINLQVIIR